MTVTTAAVFGATGAAADSGFPRATVNTDVSQNNKSPVRDMATANVAVDPNDARHIAVVGGDWRLGSCNLYVSTDGGATFAVGKRSPLPAQFDTCTPNGGTNAWGIGFDKSGNILVALLAANRPSTDASSGSIVLSRTSDNGTTWQSTLVKDNRQTTPPQGAAQVQLVIDQARNRVYVGWQGRNIPAPGYVPAFGAPGTQRRPEVAVSTDDGASFGQPVDVAGDPASTLGLGNGPNLALGPDGTVYAFYATSGAGKASPAVYTSQKPGMFVAKSTDGGATFSKAGTIATTIPTFFGFPAIAAAPYAHGGTALVVVYEAIASGSAGSQYQLRDIWSQNSTDGGSTWNAPLRVTDDDIGTDLGNKFVPGISSAPNGRFDAAWIDFRDDNGNLLTNTYYASSSDGGATWSKNVKVSDVRSDRHYGQFANNSDVRSNVNLASNNYAASIVWDDSRQASPSQDIQDIYYGAVQQAAIPESTSTVVLWVIAAVAGGLVAASLILVGAGLMVRRRRGGGRPTAAPPMAGTPAS